MMRSMNGRNRLERRRRTLWAAVILLAMLAFGSLVTGTGYARTAPVDGTVPDDNPVGDGESVYLELLEAQEALAQINRRGLPEEALDQMAKADKQMDRALAALQDLDGDFVRRSDKFYKALSRAERALSKAGRLAADRDTERDLVLVQQVLIGVGRLMAVDFLAHGRSVGVDQLLLDKAAQNLADADQKVDWGDYGEAMLDLGLVVKDIGQDLVFDLDLFEQGIQDYFAGDVVGMAYVINKGGAPVREFHAGFRRKPGEPGDDGIYLFFEDTELMVASVSKTVTAVGVMHMLQTHGLTPDDSVAPYLPAHWNMPASIEDLTFRDLMTHQSGLNGFFSGSGTVKCGSDYFALKSCIEQGIDPADKVFGYQNANYALFRIILPLMDDADFRATFASDACLITPGICDNVAALNMGLMFETLMRCQIFDPMNLGEPGVAGCNDGPSIAPEQFPQALMYTVPGVVESGFATVDHHPTAGGYGWYFSASELGKLLAYTRYSNVVLNNSSRSLMNNGYLGWMDPANYGWASGLFGPYNMHGGDWDKDGGKEINTCVVNFPQGYQVALVVNSQINPDRYQCEVLRDAYDAAWLPE